MKSMNVKKLAALAVGALFAGQAAAAGLVAETLPTDKAWYLNSAIVIGANAQPADVVWAGNIAAAIGQMAFTEETKTIEVTAENAKVKLSVPGEIVVGGQGVRETYVFDPNNAEIDSANNTQIVATGTDVPSLPDSEEFTYRIKDTEWKDEKAYLTQKIEVNYFDAMAYVPEGSDTAEMIAYTKTGKVSFITEITGLDFGTGVYTDDNFGGIDVTILGKTYKITEVNIDGSKVTLTLYEKEATIPVGGEYDLGDGYTLKVVDIDPDSKAAYVELYKDGTKVADDIVDLDSATSTKNTTDFGGELKEPITLVAVFSGTETKFAKFQIAKKTITLEEGQPGEEDEPAEGWTLSAVKVDPDAITLVASYTGDEESTYIDKAKALKAGDVMWFPGDKYGVAFEGFESKPMIKLEIDGKTVTLNDMDGRTHTVKLYESVEYTPSTQFSVTGLIDGESVKMSISATEINYDADLDGEITSGETKSLADLNSDYSNTIKIASLGFDVDSDGTDEIYYVAIVDTANEEVYLTLSGQVAYDGSLTFSNVDTKKMPYYMKVKVDRDYNASANDTTLGIEQWEIYVPNSSVSDWDSPIVIKPVYKDLDDDDTNTVNVVDKIDFTETKISYAGETFDADPETTDPVNWYTPYGAEFKVKGATEFCVKSPTEQRKLKFFVGEPAKTIEAGSYFEVAVGETVDIGGTPIKVEGIEGAEPVTYTEYKPMKDWNPERVFLDNQQFDTYDKIIVVGGYLVNEVAKMLAEEYNELYEIDTEGEWIVKKYDYEGKEYLVVFGYTAGDTGTAAHELIMWLKENVA